MYVAIQKYGSRETQQSQQKSKWNLQLPGKQTNFLRGSNNNQLFISNQGAAMKYSNYQKLSFLMNDMDTHL